MSRVTIQHAFVETIRRDEHGVYVRGRKYSLGEISRGSGVSRPHVTRVFNGKRGMSLTVAERIAGFLGIPIDALLGFLRRPTL
jgi:transcriptional regulator with XRE-family HTH domain